MTRNILESDEVDSKIFEGRVLSLLGEIIQEQTNIKRFLEEKFFLPPEVSRENRDEMDEGGFDESDLDEDGDDD